MQTLSLARTSFSAQNQAVDASAFKAYLIQSFYEPFSLNLQDATLKEVIRACVSAKSKMHRQYKESLGCLIHNLEILEAESGVTLMPRHVTDIFWEYFIAFCQERGLKESTVCTMCNQLRSILNWAVKYNASVSPTYNDVRIPKPLVQEIALTADEVSRIAYFDIDRFYAGRRPELRNTMHRVRDMFVLSCNLFQRHSDMVRIEASCFERGIFRIRQQKTGNLAVVNIERYSIDAKTTFRILEKYGYTAPYTATIGNYNSYLHGLMRDVGLTDTIRIEERKGGFIVAENIPKWKLITSHTARRTATTVAVLRGHNIHAIKRCTGHTDLRCLEKYVCDD
jgi:integrase